MSPFERKAHFEAIHAENRARQAARELIPVSEFESELARQTKIAVQAFETLPDIVERDCGAEPRIIDRIELVIDDLRRDLYACLVDDKLDTFVEGHGREARTTQTEPVAEATA